MGPRHRATRGEHPTATGQPPGLNAAVVGIDTSAKGYTLVASDGGVFNFGTQFRGSMGGKTLAAPIVDLACTSGGYWLLGADGGVFAFDVPFMGRPDRLNKPVGRHRPDTERRRLLGRGGRRWRLLSTATPCSTARRATRCSTLRCVGIAPSADGYLLAAADGGVFTFERPF